MTPTNAEIDAYLNLLIPTAGTETDCPICHEPYPDYDFNRASDYPACPYERPEGTQCRHIFGRLCIEEHVRGGEEYSTRCPSCREEWIRFSQDERAISSLGDFEFDASSEFEAPGSDGSDGSFHGTGTRNFPRTRRIRSYSSEDFELDDDLLHPTLNRRVQAMRARRNAVIGVRLRRRSSISTTSDDGERGLLSVRRGAMAQVAPEDQYSTPARRLERIVSRLERMREIYEYGNATAGVLMFLGNVEDAVESLSLLVEERDVTN
ncbi:hypothetical protein HBI56_000730 [Parastagonospora nodorum]|nr:hypothetical protein HBI09_001050 [Parastagonospora nodorum]KAH4111348.1 hypothetical protein HBH46_000730 [Parastagonospora nodorum]KAH4608115.1 hypothetical protein HBH82_086610 [Parastagonospora nodorum]KAH4696471.1 hypothetical protein HBH78_064860 [Parastagonospora nodorum]KAH4709649.1 hypothetical protein HBH67_050600 [Parastagonospora nodorum]